MHEEDREEQLDRIQSGAASIDAEQATQAKLRRDNFAMAALKALSPDLVGIRERVVHECKNGGERLIMDTTELHAIAAVAAELGDVMIQRLDKPRPHQIVNPPKQWSPQEHDDTLHPRGEN